MAAASRRHRTRELTGREPTRLPEGSGMSSEQRVSQESPARNYLDPHSVSAALGIDHPIRWNKGHLVPLR